MTSEWPGDWKAAAEEMDALKDTGREMDGLVRVKANVSRSPRAVVSVRMSPAELKEISEAAGTIDANVSEFIREAAMRRAEEVKAGADQARRVLAAYLPSRYRADMTDEEVQTLLRELRNAVLDASSFLPAKTA